MLGSNFAGLPVQRPAKDAPLLIKLLVKYHINPVSFLHFLYGALVSAPLSHFLNGLLQKAFAGKVSVQAKIGQLLASNLLVAPIQNTGAHASCFGCTHACFSILVWRSSFSRVDGGHQRRADESAGQCSTCRSLARNAHIPLDPRCCEGRLDEHDAGNLGHLPHLPCPRAEIRTHGGQQCSLFHLQIVSTLSSDTIPQLWVPFFNLIQFTVGVSHPGFAPHFSIVGIKRDFFADVLEHQGEASQARRCPQASTRGAGEAGPGEGCEGDPRRALNAVPHRWLVPVVPLLWSRSPFHMYLSAILLSARSKLHPFVRP